MSLIRAFAASLTMDDMAGWSDGTMRPWEPEFNPADPDYRAFTAAGGMGWTRDRMFHFFGPSGPTAHDIAKWNEPQLWRQHFNALNDQWVAVCEDIFGHQFLVRRVGSYKAVRMLLLWTGAVSVVAGGFEDFVRDFIMDPEVSGGMCALRDAIVARPGMEFRTLSHLSPIIPVLLGGSGDDPANFEWCESVANASIQGQIVSQHPR